MALAVASRPMDRDAGLARVALLGPLPGMAPAGPLAPGIEGASAGVLEPSAGVPGGLLESLRLVPESRLPLACWRGIGPPFGLAALVVVAASCVPVGPGRSDASRV